MKKEDVSELILKILMKVFLGVPFGVGLIWRGIIWMGLPDVGTLKIGYLIYGTFMGVYIARGFFGKRNKALIQKVARGECYWAEYPEYVQARIVSLIFEGVALAFCEGWVFVLQLLWVYTHRPVSRKTYERRKKWCVIEIRACLDKINRS